MTTHRKFKAALLCAPTVLFVLACGGDGSKSASGDANSSGGASSSDSTSSLGGTDSSVTTGSTTSTSGSGGESTTTSTSGGTTNSGAGGSSSSMGGSSSGGGTSTGAAETTDGSAGSPTASRCDASDLLFCEDFESGIDDALWTTSTNEGGTVEIDSTRAARGNASLKTHVPPGGGAVAALVQESTFPVPNNTFFVRVFVYTDGPFPVNHLDLAQARGESDLPFVGLAMGDEAQTGEFEWLYHGQNTESALFPENPPTLPTGRWVCLEWGLMGDTNEIVTYLDDEELTQLTVTPAEGWEAPQYSSLTLGTLLFHDETVAGFDFWFDEVAIDGARIGCDR